MHEAGQECPAYVVVQRDDSECRSKERRLKANAEHQSAKQAGDQRPSMKDVEREQQRDDDHCLAQCSQTDEDQVGAERNGCDQEIRRDAMPLSQPPPRKQKKAAKDRKTQQKPDRVRLLHGVANPNVVQQAQEPRKHSGIDVTARPAHLFPKAHVAPIDESLGDFQVLLVFVGVIKALGVDGSNYA